MDIIKKYHFKLTIPKSVNALYNSRYNPKTGRSMVYMNADAKQAKELLCMEIRVQVMENGCPKFGDKTIIGEISTMNMRKNRDMNNIHKLLWDAFEAEGIVNNDKSIIDRNLYKATDDSKEKYMNVWIYEAAGKPTDNDISQYFFWLKDKQELTS